MLDVLKIVTALLLGLLVGPWLRSYLQKKGKNFATKEDVKDITDRVESVRSIHAQQLEQVRTELVKHSDLVSRKRTVYTRLSKSMRVFIDGSAAPELKAEFLADYAELWIWASDDVVRSSNHFIDSQLKHTANSESVSQDEMKKLYVDAMLSMRRDAGINDTKLFPSDFRFVKF